MTLEMLRTSLVGSRLDTLRLYRSRGASMLPKRDLRSAGPPVRRLPRWIPLLRLATHDLRPRESCLALPTASFPRSSQHPSRRAPTSLVPDTALLLCILTSPVTQLPRPKGPCGEGARSPLITRCLFLERLLSLYSHTCSNDRFRGSSSYPGFSEGCHNTHDQLQQSRHRAYKRESWAAAYKARGLTDLKYHLQLH